jgi:hypothetical protein
VPAANTRHRAIASDQPRAENFFILFFTAIFFLGADPQCVGLVLCLRSVLLSSQKRGRNARRFFFWAFRWAKELETTLRKMKPKGVQHESILEHFGVHLGSFWIHFEAGGAPGSLWAALGAGVVKKRAKVTNFPPKAPPQIEAEIGQNPNKIYSGVFFVVFWWPFSRVGFGSEKVSSKGGSKSTKLVQNQ